MHCYLVTKIPELVKIGWAALVCTRDPMLTSNCGISGPGRGDLESMSRTGIFLPWKYFTV